MFRKLITTLAAGTAILAGVSSAFAGDLTKMSWDEIVEQAKAEGELNWYIWYFRDDFRAVAKGFEDKYGIKVTIPEGTNNGNLEKLVAETGRESGDIDVIALPYNRSVILDLEKIFSPVVGIVPDLENRTQDLTGIPGKGRLLAYWGNQTGIAYDPDKVADADLPQTPEDFANFWTANPNKMGFNYVKGGSGISYFHNMLRSLSDVDYFGDGGIDVEGKLAGLQGGIDFFNKHAENYVVTASNADSITRVSDRELWLAPAWEDNLAGLQKKGEVRKEIKFYIPSMGMSGGGNAVAVPVNAPHPAAAMVFMEWLTSAEVQTSFNQNFGTVTMHSQADASKALVANEQRQYRQAWPTNPFRKAAEDLFTEEVILNR